MLIEKLNEVAINVSLTFKVIAGRRLKADLYGLKAEKAHVSGKMLSRCVRSPSTFVFLMQLLLQQPVKSPVTTDRVGIDLNLRCAYRFH